jgi:hypothetical protein
MSSIALLATAVASSFDPSRSDDGLVLSASTNVDRESFSGAVGWSLKSNCSSNR